MQMKLFIDQQVTPIHSEVNALISIVRPILTGILFSTKEDVVKELGGYDKVKLKILPRLYRPGDGDVGIAFEWAVHDAIQRKDPLVLDRLSEAGKLCKLGGSDFASLLFGVEKSGRTKLIDSAGILLSDDSRLLTGAQAQPIKLKRYLKLVAAAFNRPDTRLALPYSINGLWKADLFFGTTDTDRWLGTTLKINPSQLQEARGLRIGIVPASQGKSDKIRKDEMKNLIVCPLPYDGAFMELFYTGWRIVQQFIAADAKVPKEVALPSPVDRQVVKELEIRREFEVMEVVEVLLNQSQTDLIKSSEKTVEVSVQEDGSENATEGLITPVAMTK
jgi:hypothetical protein